MKMSCTDRFIGLPDDVICQILSFLPTKYSAQTSLLAKCWRYLWSRVPSLEFKCGRRKLRGDFVHPNIIDRVLSHREANISSFQLSYTYYDDYDGDTNTKLESWIATIITRSVSNLNLSLRDRIKLPRCLFTCETLVDLSLTCGEIPVGVAVYFPALKRLKLTDVDDYYESDESLPHLLSGCPVLEELSIHATDECVRCWCISLPKLTRLVLILEEKQRSFANHKKQKDFRVKLDTPALRYLRLSVSTAENVFVGTVLDSLIEADVAVYDPQWLGEQNCLFRPRDSIEENFLYVNSVKDILGVLYNVKFLTLINDAMEVPDDDYWFPDSMGVKFHSLTKLDVLTTEWPLIISLLGNANLRVLNILDVVQSRNNHVMMEPKQVPSCLISHLQKVNMDSMPYPLIKLDIAKYILINAKVLKKMKMQVWTSDNNFEPLSSIQIGSPTCKLVFI